MRWRRRSRVTQAQAVRAERELGRLVAAHPDEIVVVAYSDAEADYYRRRGRATGHTVRVVMFEELAQ